MWKAFERKGEGKLGARPHAMDREGRLPLVSEQAFHASCPSRILFSFKTPVTQARNRPFHGFSTFDMDKFGTIRRHHWKERLILVNLPSFKVMHLKVIP